MLWVWVIIFGMMGISLFAYLKPNMFKRYVESLVGAWWVTGVSALTMIVEYLKTDTAWHELVSKENLPLAITLVGIGFILLRLMNIGKR